MDKKAIEQIVFETLEKCGINVPVEHKFDYSCTEMPEKAKEFIRLTNGNPNNAIYVSKNGERDGDTQYFDLLFAVNEQGEPVCIPVPIARKLFGKPINTFSCKGTILGHVYEAIYKHYYEQNSTPF